MSEMLIHTPTLKYRDIHATSFFQSSQRKDTTLRSEASRRPCAIVKKWRPLASSAIHLHQYTGTSKQKMKATYAAPARHQATSSGRRLSGERSAPAQTLN